MDVVKTKKSGGFESLGLQPGVFRAIKMKGYDVPTPIQRKSIPLIMAGYDIVACSKTGSGKTAAFIIPMVNKLLNHSTTVGVRGLLVLPTRELALQTASVLKTFIKYTDLEYSLLVGGHGFEGQLESLAKNPDILICTPGRIVQHLLEGRLQLSRVQLVIYDEADFLFDMGMADQLKTVLNYLPPTKQSLIFSATIPEQLSMFASVGLKDYIYVKLDSEFFLPETMKLNFLLVSNEHKQSALIYLVGMVEDRCIVFASTRYLVDLIVFALAKFEISAVNIYGKMDQQDRKEQLDSFKYSDAKVLVVTDLASRGIDIPFVSNVIHYDYPAKPKIYIVIKLYFLIFLYFSGSSSQRYSILSQRIGSYFEIFFFMICDFWWVSSDEKSLFLLDGQAYILESKKLGSKSRFRYSSVISTLIPCQKYQLTQNIAYSMSQPVVVKIGTVNPKLEIFDDGKQLAKAGGMKKINAIRIFYTDNYVRGFEIFYKLHQGDLLKAGHNVPSKRKEVKSAVFEIGPDDYLSEIQAACTEVKNKNLIANITFLTYRGKVGTYGGKGEQTIRSHLPGSTFGTFRGGFKKKIEWLEIEVLPLPFEFKSEMQRLGILIEVNPNQQQHQAQPHPKPFPQMQVARPNIIVVPNMPNIAVPKPVGVNIQTQQAPPQPALSIQSAPSKANSMTSSKYPSFDAPPQAQPFGMQNYGQNKFNPQQPPNQPYPGQQFQPQGPYPGQPGYPGQIPGYPGYPGQIPYSPYGNPQSK